MEQMEAIREGLKELVVPELYRAVVRREEQEKLEKRVAALEANYDRVKKQLQVAA